MSNIEKLPDAKNRKRQKRAGLKVVIVVVASILVAVGVVAGIRLAYNNGKSAGISETQEQIQHNLKDLAEAVAEKTTINEKLQQLSNDVPTEMNADGIAKYLENLDKVMNDINNQQVKEVLNDYKQSWVAFQEAYKSEDNKKIEDSFAELRAKGAETGEKITDILNRQIKDVSERLNE